MQSKNNKLLKIISFASLILAALCLFACQAEKIDFNKVNAINITSKNAWHEGKVVRLTDAVKIDSLITMIEEGSEFPLEFQEEYNLELISSDGNKMNIPVRLNFIKIDRQSIRLNKDLGSRLDEMMNNVKD